MLLDHIIRQLRHELLGRLFDQDGLAEPLLDDPPRRLAGAEAVDVDLAHEATIGALERLLQLVRLNLDLHDRLTVGALFGADFHPAPHLSIRRNATGL